MARVPEFDWKGYRAYLASGGAPFLGKYNATIHEAIETYRDLIEDYGRALRKIRDRERLGTAIDAQKWAAGIARDALAASGQKQEASGN